MNRQQAPSSSHQLAKTSACRRVGVAVLGLPSSERVRCPGRGFEGAILYVDTLLLELTFPLEGASAELPPSCAPTSGVAV